MEGFQPSATAPTSGSLNGYAVSESLPSLSVVETTISTTALSQATSNNFAPVTLVSSRHSSDPELNYALPTSNSNLPLSSAVPSSMSSNPGGLCVVNSGNSTTRENNLMPEMEYFFNLMYQIPFPPSTDLPSQQPILVEERERVDTVQQLPASTPLSAASESLPTISTVEPSSTTTTTALSQPPRNCTPASLFSSELTSGSFGAASESLSIVEPSSTTTTTTAFSQPSSSNFAPVSFVSSRHSSDPELNDALHTLLSDGGNMCSGEDTVVSDEIPPYLFGLPTFLLPVVPRPSSADVLSHMQGPIVVEGRTDTLQHSMSSNLDGLHVLPTSNSNLSLSRNTSAVPSSVSSNPGGLCAVNSGNSTTRENNLTPEMKYFFDLLYQIPLPPSAGLPSQEVSQPTLVEERERVDTLQRLPSSTSLSAATESLPTMSTLESSCTTTTTALSQPPSSNISPVSLESSRHSLNNALNILFSDGDNKCGGEDLPSPSQRGVLSQSASELQPVDTSLTQSHHLSVPLSTSLPSSAYGMPSSTCCDLRALVSEDSNMTPELEYCLDLFSLAPSINLLSQPTRGISQRTGVEQGISQPMRREQGISQPMGLEQGISQPMGMEQGISQPMGMEQGISQPTGVEQGISQPMGMEQGISQPMGVEQGVSQRTGMEQEIAQPTGMEQGISERTGRISQPTGMELTSEDSNMTPELEYFLDLFSLAPSISLLSQGISQHTRMEQGMSQPTGMEQETSKLTGMEQGISQPTGMEQGISQPEQGTLMEQDVPQCMSEQNMHGPSTSSHHLLPIGDQLSHLQREKSSPSPSQFSCCSPTPADSASTDQSTAGSLPPTPLSDDFHSVRREESSAVSVRPLSKKRKTYSAVQKKQQQRKLNKVCALHYRSRKKGKESCLEARRKELEDTNAQLKKQVSILTAEIYKLRQRTRKTKICSFFLHSTCSKLKS